MPESRFIQVNGEQVSLENVLSRMRLTGAMASLVENVVKDELIKQASVKAGLSASEEELQKKADERRSDLGLYMASDTQQWLEGNKLSVMDLEDYCESLVLREKFKEYLARDKVDEFFAKNSLNFDRAEISLVVVPEESVARELMMQVKDEGVAFEDLPQTHSMSKENVRPYLNDVRRYSFNPDFEAAIFGAESGEVVGPLKSEDGFYLIKVHAVHRGELNDETRGQIKELILADWLNKAGESAQVEMAI